VQRSPDANGGLFVPHSTRRLCSGCLTFATLVVLGAGCAPKPAVPSVVVVHNAEEESSGPNEILLSDPKVTLVEPTIVQFEVKYRFTQGRPNKHYSCDLSFPDTPNHGVKLMQSWELKAEGVIKDGIVLSKPPVKTFEIQVSEAPTPQDRYQKISNVVSGPVQKR
jgi:hypothetical protein